MFFVKFALKFQQIGGIIAPFGTERRVMKKVILVLLFIVSVCAFTFATSFNRIIYPIDTKDASGYVLTQYQAPQRIISAAPYITEILFEFNSSDRIVGVTKKGTNYPEDAKKLPEVGGDKLDKGKMLKAEPDLVIVPYNMYKNDIPSLRQIKFTVKVSDEVQLRTLEVFAVEPLSLSDILRNISVIGTITNREHAAYSLNERMKRSIGWVEARAKNEKKFRHFKALVLVSRRPTTFAGRGTYLNDLMRMAGLIDVTPSSKDLYVRMKREEIKKADPDIIITSTSVARNPKDIYNNGDFRDTSAGKNKMVICIDDDIFSRPGPRVTQLLEQIGDFTYGWKVNNEQDK